MIAAIAFGWADSLVPLWSMLAAISLVFWVVVQPQVDGTYQLVMSRDSELWTSKDLRRTLGRGWRVIRGLHFWHGDVDHIAVGPGGIYVVEVKATDSQLDLASQYGQTRIHEWTEAVNRRARSTRLLLKRHGVCVKAIIVIWGVEVTGEPQMHEGVRILPRRDLTEELKTWIQEPPRLTKDEVSEIAGDLKAQRRIQT